MSHGVLELCFAVIRVNSCPFAVGSLVCLRVEINPTGRSAFKARRGDSLNVKTLERQKNE
jgi:hypothetical protein